MKTLFNAVFGTLASIIVIGGLCLLILGELQLTGQSLTWNGLVPQWSADARSLLIRYIQIGAPFVLLYLALSLGAGVGVLRSKGRGRQGALIAFIGSLIVATLLGIVLLAVVPDLSTVLSETHDRLVQVIKLLLPDSVKSLAPALALVWLTSPIWLSSLGAYLLVASPFLYVLLALLSPGVLFLPFIVLAAIALFILFIIAAVADGLSGVFGSSGSGGGSWGTAEANRISNERHSAALDAHNNKLSGGGGS